jgi:AraC-like DNA-binding protein
MRGIAVNTAKRQTNARGRRPIADGIIRVGPCMAIPGILRGHGVSPETVLADVGMSMQIFDDPDNVIPYATMGTLIARCVQSTGLPDMGLRIGREASTSSLGIVGFLVENSPDVGAALRNLVAHQPLHDRGGAVTLRSDGTTATLCYVRDQHGIEGADQIADGALAIGLNVMRALCGADFKLSSVRLKRPQPADAEPYGRAFGAPVQFAAEENGLLFPASWLAHRLPGADEDLRRALERQIHAAEVLERSSLDHMRRVLRTLLHTGGATETRLANLFAMHRRTVNRRLRAEGTTFRRLVDEVRFEVARHLLETSALRVGEIAGFLDYADASAFTRAFRRWSATTPARWRLTHAGQGASDGPNRA